MSYTNWSNASRSTSDARSSDSPDPHHGHSNAAAFSEQPSPVPQPRRSSKLSQAYALWDINDQNLGSNQHPPARPPDPILNRTQQSFADDLINELRTSDQASSSRTSLPPTNSLPMHTGRMILTPPQPSRSQAVASSSASPRTAGRKPDVEALLNDWAFTGGAGQKQKSSSARNADAQANAILADLESDAIAGFKTKGANPRPLSAAAQAIWDDLHQDDGGSSPAVTAADQAAHQALLSIAIRKNQGLVDILRRKGVGAGHPHVDRFLIDMKDTDLSTCPVKDRNQILASYQNAMIGQNISYEDSVMKIRIALEKAFPTSLEIALEITGTQENHTCPVTFNEFSAILNSPEAPFSTIAGHTYTQFGIRESIRCASRDPLTRRRLSSTDIFPNSGYQKILDKYQSISIKARNGVVDDIIRTTRDDIQNDQTKDQLLQDPRILTSDQIIGGKQFRKGETVEGYRYDQEAARGENIASKIQDGMEKTIHIDVKRLIDEDDAHPNSTPKAPSNIQLKAYLLIDYPKFKSDLR